MRLILTAAIVAMIALHQDIWNWPFATPFLLGLPVGLWYHALYTLAAAGLMATLVRHLWPHDLDDSGDSDR